MPAKSVHEPEFQRDVGVKVAEIDQHMAGAAAWMFDRTACPDAEPLTAQPSVSIDALAAFSALLDHDLS
jgi:hypothetical protein